MKRLTVATMLLVGVALSAQGLEQKANLPTCPQGWTAGPDADWKIFWNDALNEARQTGKKIFALSTGSDWCKKLKKEVLTTEEFKAFAKKNLVLLYLDSPRKPLPEAQTLHNRTICRELGLSGGVPCAAVFAADARQLGVLSGGGYTASNYIERLEKMLSNKGEQSKSGQPSKIFTEGYAESGRFAKDETMLDRESQEELKRLAVEIRAEKLAKAENEINAVKWTYEIVDGGVVLGRGGKGFGPAIDGDAFGALVIPEKIDGKPVRSIGNRVFEGRSGLTSVTIPQGVINIGSRAFSGCSGLTSVTIPEGVERIGGCAFGKCRRLMEIRMPSTVRKIGPLALEGDPVPERILTAPGDAERILGLVLTNGHSKLARMRSFQARYGQQSKDAGDRQESRFVVEGDALVRTTSGFARWRDPETGIAWLYSVQGDNAADVRTEFLKGYEGHLEVPAQLGGKQVSGLLGLDGGGDITSLSLPMSVTNVNSKALASCTKLKSVKMNVEGELKTVGMEDLRKQWEAQREARRAAQREARRAEQEQERAEQLLAIQEELKRVREAKAAEEKQKGK